MIVACCGTNFCMLAADKMKSLPYKGKNTVISNVSEKIFKINNSILFGGTGTFWGHEEIYEPIKGRMNDRLSIVDAVKLTEQYMYDNLAYVSMMRRNYFITGKDNDDIYYLVRVSLNEEEKSVQTISYVPKTISQKATMIALPRTLGGVEFARKYNNMLNDFVKHAESLPDLYFGCSKIIREASSDDSSKIVGCIPSFVSIHN